MKTTLLRLITSLALSALVMLAGCSENETPLTSNTSSSTTASADEMMAAYAGDIAATVDPALTPRTPAELSELSAGIWTNITTPTVITEPGFYRVTADFTATGDGIVIECDNVVLRMGDHTITGPGTKMGRGVYVNGAKYVHVFGGTLTNFGFGVVMNNSSKSWVRNVSVDGADDEANPPAGIPPQIGIMLVNSYQNFIFGNEIILANLGIFVRGGGSYDNQIFNNIALGGDRGLLGICYNPAMGEGDAGPSGDLVRHNFLARFGTGIQTSSGSTNNAFRRNTLLYFTSAYQDLNGSNAFERNRSTQIPM